MLTSLALVAALQATPIALPKGALKPFPDDPEFDDRIGSWFNFESDVRDFGFVYDEAETWLVAINNPALRMEVVNIPSGQVALTIPAGPGLVTCERRPGTSEVWLVDSVTSSIAVVDLPTLSITHTIRVGGEPHELLFGAEGKLAYVSCSASHDVVVLDAVAKKEVDRVATGLDTPRGMAIVDGVLWVASFFSGNGTTTVLLPDNYLPGPSKHEKIVDTTTVAGVTPLPDVDLVGFALSTTGPSYVQAIPGARATGLGTILLDAVARPGTKELWVPNTEALNLVKGEVNFVEGQVISNRIAIVDTTNPSSPTILDLDAIAPAGVRCSQPTSVVFDVPRARAYVFGYSSDLIAVLDTSVSPPLWAGHYPIAANGLGAGPRCGFLGPGADRLYVFSKADNGYSVVDLNVPPTGLVAPPAPGTFGYDPTPEAVKRGRARFNDATLSKSRTSACNSCHLDGHLDKVIWDLSAFLDPEGTAPDQLVLERDRKGPMVTQSLRSLADTGPYHWRGERPQLADFNVTFQELFEHTDQSGEPAQLPDDEFAELERYVLSLVYPPNPRQRLDRGYTPAQQHGSDLFHSELLGGIAGCVVCHAAPIGTNGEVQRENGQFEFSASIAVPQLRGVGDKDSPLHVLGGGFEDATELGLGFTHDGHSPTLLRFVQDNFGNITPEEKLDVHEFLQVFDTGLAPTTGYQATVNASNHATFLADELQVLLDAADAGDCDVVLVSRRLPSPGGPIRIQGAYDRATGKFQLPWAGTSQFAPKTFVDLASTGWGSTTFLGVPLGMGWRWGVDLDADGLLNYDEETHGTLVDDPDTDGDTFPDGHEVENGMNPLVADATSTDGTPPDLVEGKLPRVFRNTNTVKYAAVTTEPARIDVRRVGETEVLATSPAVPGYDVNHELIVGGLADGALHALQFELTDPAGNSRVVTKSVQTLDDVAQLTTRVEAIDVQIDETQTGLVLDAVATVRITLTDRDGGALGADVPLNGFLYHRIEGQPIVVLHQFKSGFSDPSGVVTLTHNLPAYTLGSPTEPVPPRTLFFGVREVFDSQGNGSGSEYVEAFDAESFGEVTY